MSGAQDSKGQDQSASSPLDRAAAAYIFGVNPGDESEASEEELRTYALRVLMASGYPSLAAGLIEDLEGIRWALENGPIIPNIEDALEVLESALARLKRFQGDRP
jgi:hypothetical protein